MALSSRVSGEELQQEGHKAYLHYNEEFLKFSKIPNRISKEDVRDYLYHLVKRDCSASTLNVAINALKFY